MTTLIKICGVRDPDLARQAIALGAQFIGILCYSQSKRYVIPEMAKKIADATLLAGGVPVAVCVDADAKMMLALCQQCGITTVQLSGDVSRQSHQELPKHIQRIYVLHVDKTGKIQPDVAKGVEQLDFDRDWIMFDGIEPGSGQTFNVNQFRNPYPTRFFLAGGLTSMNVVAMINAIHPNAVDVSSGVESGPGIKDINKINRFIKAVKEVNQ